MRPERWQIFQATTLIFKLSLKRLEWLENFCSPFLHYRKKSGSTSVKQLQPFLERNRTIIELFYKMLEKDINVI